MCRDPLGSHTMKNMAWVLCLLLISAGCDFEERMPIEMVTLNQTQPLGKEKTLESTIRFDIGSVEITAKRRQNPCTPIIWNTTKSAFPPKFITTRLLTEQRDDFISAYRIRINWDIHPQRFTISYCFHFNESLPLKLKVNAGVGDARLSLSGLKVSQIDFESGVGEAKMSAYEPNSIPCEYIKLKNGVGRLEAIGLGNFNFRELEFEGGVGGASLDFTGEWKQNADIRIKVGVGGVNVRLPREIGVKVEAEKNFLSGLHLEGFNKQDSYYYSENYD